MILIELEKFVEIGDGVEINVFFVEVENVGC